MIKSFGPFYTGTLSYYHRKALPVVEKGWTQETERPYRKGTCLVFRLPFTHPGFYVGVWNKSPKINIEDDDAVDALLANAMGVRTVWEPEDGLYDETFLQIKDPVHKAIS